MDIAGDQAHPEEPDARRAPPAAAEPVSRQRRRRGRSGGADDRAFQAGERVAGVVVVEDQHGRRPWDAGRHVLRETGDPLQTIHPHLPADRSGQRDDPRGRAVGETQEVRRRVHRITGAVQPVGALDQLHDVVLAALQRVLDLSTGDHRERRHGERLGAVGHGGLRGGGTDGGHREVTSTGGEQSARRTASAIATSTSRGPSKGSLLCAVRTLSTSIRSPACHGSRAVLAS